MFELFKTKVIIDTNMFFVPGELGIDIFSELKKLINEPSKFCAMSGTEVELKAIIEKSRAKKEGFNAKLGFIMLKQKDIKLIDHKEAHVDDAIVELAKNTKCYVCTQDKDLKKRLKDTKAIVIVLKQKKYLDFES
jgi:uncharacterized protein